MISQNDSLITQPRRDPLKVGESEVENEVAEQLEQVLDQKG